MLFCKNIAFNTETSFAKKNKIQDNLKGTIGTCRTPARLAVPPLAERTPTARSTDRWELKPGFNMDHMVTLRATRYANVSPDSSRFRAQSTAAASLTRIPTPES